MKREKQLLFEQLNQLTDLDFGGSLLKKSHAKIPRPISAKKAMHVVLRSSKVRAKLSFLLSPNSKIIHRVVEKQAQRHGVKLYKMATAYNHIHLVILPRSRDAFKAFVRSVSGLIPRYLASQTIEGRKNGESIDDKGFWDQRPWSRIITWGREYKGVLRYLEQNLLEAFGFIPYQPRKTRFSSA